MPKITALLYTLPGLPLLVRGMIDLILREPGTAQLFRSEERDVNIDRTIFLHYQQVVLPAALTLGALEVVKWYDLRLPAYNLMVAFFSTMLGINARTVGFMSAWHQWSDALQETIQLCIVLAVIQVVYLSPAAPTITRAAAIVGLCLWALGMARRLLAVCRAGVDARIRAAVLADRGERKVIPDLTILPGSGDQGS